MTDIINLILIIIGIILASRLVSWISKRVSLCIKLSSLKGMCGARITYRRSPFLPMCFMSDQADIIVEILDTVYLIRLYSGGDFTKYVHFADTRYSVIFSRINAGRFAASSRIASRLITLADTALNIGMRVKLMPEFNVSDDERFYRKNVVRVLLFNPAPHEVTYVTEETTSIRTAFDGDEIYGMKVFTASSFVAHADRETRKDDSFIYF